MRVWSQVRQADAGELASGSDGVQDLLQGGRRGLTGQDIPGLAHAYLATVTADCTRIPGARACIAFHTRPGISNDEDGGRFIRM